MDREHQRHRSHLFTVRLWQEELSDGVAEWRGKVQHVHSGEAFYFREWSALVEGLQKLLSQPVPYPETD